ncbi:efflux RND transporter periplasmic adaptor subunit [Siphonobacter sp. SORGH_AS_1065]|uniref:efflux RND transporter periplasmic adaptor subunit n=1 Tax=Siphonobacter sp. SORGH_AS_1065 TaxID=3041795 RepID=UPI0027850A38|nr:efflux RND transporter periplasmic adaptor subunit [Siphonobacter sp. SORGH_AS_1065]MDQ1088166.1 membrane fusion protein (multidrug efflux system) [Siphonobacter sp. SORGH_AS_1065]
MKSSSLVRWLLVVAIVGSIGYLVYGKLNRIEKKKAGNESKSAGAGGSKALTVDGYIASTEKLDNTIVTSGTLQSNEEISLQSELSARVIKIYFKEGQLVPKGALLVKLYDADLSAQALKVRTQRQLAQKSLERLQYLLEREGVSKQEVDVAQSQVDAFDADMAVAKAQLQRTEIRAPFAGKIGLRYVSEGAIVTPTTVIASFQQTNPLKVDFSIPEKYTDQVRVGDVVSFNVASETKAYQGKVYAIEPKIDLATRTVKLRALVPNASNQIRPGQFAQVKLRLGETPQALMVPSQAIIPGTKEKQVVISRQGKASFQTVETGTRTDTKVQILSGIQAGDTVITTGILQIKPDQVLKIRSVKK